MKKGQLRFHKVLILLGIVYLFFLAGIYLLQEKIIFLPTQEIYLEIDKAKINAEEFMLEVDAKTSIHGYLFTNGEANKTILFFHGNGGNLTGNFGRVAIAKKLGFNIAVFDYRGYGKSTGKITSEQNIYEDAEKVYEYLTEEQKIPRENIIFWGQSLGGAVATEMAQRHSADKLILESTFTSLENMTPKVLQYSIPSFLKKYKFDNLKKIAGIKSPIMIIHSTEDEMIDFSNAEKLFDQAGEPKQLIQTTGSHNSGLLESFEDYENSIKRFLEK